MKGNRRVPFAFTAIRGIGRRYSIACVKKAQVDPTKRAGELNSAEVKRIVDVLEDPIKAGLPLYYLNRQKDRTTGKWSHTLGGDLTGQLRNDLERLKKIRNHRGLRHYWGLPVRGQHTNTTGRGGRKRALHGGR